MSGLAQPRARLAAALAWRPEWPFAVVVALAWAVLLVGAFWPSAPAVDGSLSAAVAPAAMAGHLEHHGHPASGAVLLPLPHAPSDSMLEALAGWGLMSVAMMLPVTLPAVGHVGINSLRRRRWRAMSLYVAVYVGVWIAFGAVVLAVVRWLVDVARLDSRVLLASTLALAAAWQATRFKRRALFQCLRTVPLPPIGLRADAGCARFGAVQAWRCVRSCWALMLVMAVVGHSALAVMVAATALIGLEELTFVGRRLLRPSAAVLGLAAGLVALGV